MTNARPESCRQQSATSATIGRLGDTFGWPTAGPPEARLGHACLSSRSMNIAKPRLCCNRIEILGKWSCRVGCCDKTP